jgi:hypothetical protein
MEKRSMEDEFMDSRSNEAMGGRNVIYLNNVRSQPLEESMARAVGYEYAAVGNVEVDPEPVVKVFSSVEDAAHFCAEENEFEAAMVRAYASHSWVKAILWVVDGV